MNNGRCDSLREPSLETNPHRQHWCGWSFFRICLHPCALFSFLEQLFISSPFSVPQGKILMSWCLNSLTKQCLLIKHAVVISLPDHSHLAFTEDRRRDDTASIATTNKTSLNPLKEHRHSDLVQIKSYYQQIASNCLQKSVEPDVFQALLPLGKNPM